MIEIDAAHGGQILRSSVGLSALTQQPCKIHNIRLEKRNPGLRTQHIQAINAVSQLCGGKANNCDIGSKFIEFYPADILSKNIQVNINTAGAVSLVLQALMIPISQITKLITVKFSGGATYGKWAPSMHYLCHVLAPQLKKIGYVFEMDLQQHGFYPKGGSNVSVTFSPIKKINPINLVDVGDIVSINGVSIASESLRRKKVAQRQAKAAEKVIKEKLGFKPEIKTEYVNSICPGSGITLWAITSRTVFGADSVGELKKSSEQVGSEAANDFVEVFEKKATVDMFLADQLLVYMAMSDQSSEVISPRLTKHIQTNIEVIKQFINTDFYIENGTVRIRCTGKQS